MCAARAIFYEVAIELCEEYSSENVFVYFLSIAVTVTPFALLLPQSQLHLFLFCSENV